MGTGSFIGDYEVKGFFHTGLNALPAKELPVSTKEGVLNTAWQLAFDFLYKFGNFLATHGFPFSKFAEKILPRFIDKTQNGAIAPFATVFRVMPLASSLLMTTEGFNGCVGTQMNLLAA